jgi:membrane-associated phospholipid phosphatase
LGKAETRGKSQSRTWLFSSDFPGHGSLFFLMAALVGFSCIYPGDHHPGDILSGGFSGIVSAKSIQRVQLAVMRAADSDVG